MKTFDVGDVALFYNGIEQVIFRIAHIGEWLHDHNGDKYKSEHCENLGKTVEVII